MDDNSLTALTVIGCFAGLVIGGFIMQAVGEYYLGRKEMAVRRQGRIDADGYYTPAGSYFSRKVHDNSIDPDQSDKPKLAKLTGEKKAPVMDDDGAIWFDHGLDEAEVRQALDEYRRQFAKLNTTDISGDFRMQKIVAPPSEDLYIHKRNSDPNELLDQIKEPKKCYTLPARVSRRRRAFGRILLAWTLAAWVLWVVFHFGVAR